MLTLRWFRDQGNGQAAATAIGAIETHNGSWPVAIKVCTNRIAANVFWLYLREQFGVNAIVYSTTAQGPGQHHNPNRRFV